MQQPNLRFLTTLAVVLALTLVVGVICPAAAQENVAAGGKKVTSLTPEQTKALDEWTYSLALQTANWGGPLVTMYCLRYNDALGPKPKAKANTIWRMENISTPELSKEAGYVTPNVNVVYGFGFMDLGAEPIILSVPDSNGLFYVVEIVDMYSNAFAYAGGKATGYKGGKFALVGPGWKGQLPRQCKAHRLPDEVGAATTASSSLPQWQGRPPHGKESAQ